MLVRIGCQFEYQATEDVMCQNFWDE